MKNSAYTILSDRKKSENDARGDSSPLRHTAKPVLATQPSTPRSGDRQHPLHQHLVSKNPDLAKHEVAQAAQAHLLPAWNRREPGCQLFAWCRSCELFFVKASVATHCLCPNSTVMASGFSLSFYLCCNFFSNLDTSLMEELVLSFSSLFPFVQKLLTIFL